MSANFSCDLAASGSALPHVWEQCLGSDRARMTLRADWQAQMKRSHDKPLVRSSTLPFEHADDTLELAINAPEQSVALITIEIEAAPPGAAH